LNYGFGIITMLRRDQALHYIPLLDDSSAMVNYEYKKFN